MKKLSALSICFFLSSIFLSMSGYSSARRTRGIVIVSTGWTGAGTGKVVDFLADKADYIVRSQGGSAKGHRVMKRMGDGFNLVLLPSGILRKNTQCYLTAGMEIDPSTLFSEIDLLISKDKKIEGRLWISSRAQVVMPYHRKIDALMTNKYGGGVDVGSKKGAGAAAADKRLRIGIRVADLLDPVRFKEVLKEDLDYANELLTKVFNSEPFEFDKILLLYTEYARRIKKYVKDDAELCINKLLLEGKVILFEGSQGTFLDISMGSYPYVGPSSTIAAGICQGAGVGPSRISHTLGIVQSYTTRIGTGPLPAQIKDTKVLNQIREAHKSYCEEIPGLRYGWVDLVLIREAILLNGIDSLVISKLDELDGLEEIKICFDYIVDGKNYDYLPPNVNAAKKIVPRYMTVPGWKKIDKNIKKFSDLPQEARNFVKRIELLSSIPVSYVSIGPRRDQMITVNDLLLL